MCAALLNKALGAERVINLHIDHGFMRHEESSGVQGVHPPPHLPYISAISRLYSGAVAARGGVHIEGKTDFADDFAASTTEINGKTTLPLAQNTSPEEKRKIIGDTFMRVTEGHVRRARPHRGERRPRPGHPPPRPHRVGRRGRGRQRAAVIKTHHNDTALVRQLRDAGRIIEPLRDYHKDEVRPPPPPRPSPTLTPTLTTGPGPTLAQALTVAQALA